MTGKRTRWLTLIVLCGTLFQTTTSCNEVVAPLLASVASTIVTSFISSLLLST